MKRLLTVGEQNFFEKRGAQPLEHGNRHGNRDGTTNHKQDRRYKCVTEKYNNIKGATPEYKQAHRDTQPLAV